MYKTDCFDSLSLPNDSNLSHVPHFALLALLSTLEKYSHIGFNFCDISLSILGLVDDSENFTILCEHICMQTKTALHSYRMIV